MKTAMFSIKPYERERLVRLNKKAKHDIEYFGEPLNADTVHLARGFNAIAISMHDCVNREVIESLSQFGVRLITLRCAGFDNIDTIASVAENITLTRVPAYSPQAIAEHAIALILGLTRKIHVAHGRTRNNDFRLDGLMGSNLYGKTIGVIGTGNIGAAFCKIMIGFGCNVLAFDINKSHRLKKLGVMYKSFGEVLCDSDVVSIHCPLNDDTRHLFDKENLALMKKGAMLINTARGGVLDTKAVIEALKTGRLGALGIDVYESERDIFFKDLSNTIVPDDTIERLLTLPNVIVTPHQAFFTNEAVEEICATTIQNLSDFENGCHLKNEI